MAKEMKFESIGTGMGRAEIYGKIFPFGTEAVRDHGKNFLIDRKYFQDFMKIYTTRR